MGNVSAVVDIYNLSNNTWTTTSLSQPRYSIAAITVGNLAIFAGGSYEEVSYKLMRILIIILRVSLQW